MTQVLHVNESLAELLASQNHNKLLHIIQHELSDDEVIALNYDWNFWARASQLPPSVEWTIWGIITGRGWGKSRTGSETVRRLVEQNKVQAIALVGATVADVRDVMVDGESGLLAVCPPWFKPTYVPSRRRLVWPNGARAYTYSSEEPERLRGPQHGLAWCDELAAWRYIEKTWDNLMFGLRKAPGQCIITTTPRPVAIVKSLIRTPDEGTVITKGNTYENLGNLDPGYRKRVLSKYEGTRTGRQELHGELLLDTPGALWSYDLIEQGRVQSRPETLIRIIVSIDPATTNSEESDETGIIVTGLAWCGCRGYPELHGYVLDDYSVHASPSEWADKAIQAYREWNADGIIGEANNGGDLIETVLRTRPFGRQVPYKKVHASRGKLTRAEPVASQYERSMWHHVGGFAELEDQMTTYAQGTTDSPDRMDALVWGATALLPSQPVKTKGTATTYTPVKIGPSI